jgi:hypothetical protein
MYVMIEHASIFAVILFPLVKYAVQPPFLWSPRGYTTGAAEPNIFSGV